MASQFVLSKSDLASHLANLEGHCPLTCCYFEPWVSMDNREVFGIDFVNVTGARWCGLWFGYHGYLLVMTTVRHLIPLILPMGLTSKWTPNIP